MFRALSLILLSLILFVVAVSPLVPAPAEAQNIPPPPGTWRDTCVDARWDGLVYQARCQNRHGVLLLTRVDMRGYGGWVTNCDGRLVKSGRCEAPTGPGFNSQARWLETCANPYWDNRIIRATCRDMNGQWREASFDTNWPMYTISNCDGRLVGSVACGDPAIDGLPAGNWSRHCRSASVENGTLRASCLTPDHQWGQYALNIRGHDGPVSFCDGVISRLPQCR